MTETFAVAATQGIKVEAIPVEVINHPQPKRFLRRAAFRSFVLTAANPYQQVAGSDALRECIRISPVTNAIVVGGSISQASDPNNLGAAITQPNGRFIPAGTSNEFIVEGTNEVWFSTGTYPTIVGVEIIRKVPE